MNFLKSSEVIESVNETLEIIKHNLENANVIVENWKCIRDRMKNLYNKRSEAFDKAVERKDNNTELFVLQMELKAAKSSFDDSEKEYQTAFTFKLSIEQTVTNIEQIYKNSLEKQVPDDPGRIN